MSPDQQASRGRWSFPRRQLDPDYARPVRREHLQARLTLDEIERANRVQDPLGAVPDLPFGHLHAAWRRFVEQLQEGDELWSFATPWEFTFPLRELRQGYVVLRAGEPGPCFLTVWRKEFDAELIRARARGTRLDEPQGKSAKRRKRGG